MTSRRDVHRAVDGELSKRDTRRLEADPEAKAEVARLKALAEAARHAVRPVTPPTEFKKKVLDELRKRPTE